MVWNSFQTSCYLTLDDWSPGEQWILFPENLNQYNYGISTSKFSAIKIWESVPPEFKLLPRGTVCFVSWSRILMFPETKGTLGFEENKNSLFPKGPVIKWFVIWQNKTKANFEKRAEIPARTSVHLWSRAKAVNISRVTVNCFLFDVIVFAMLPAYGIWWETCFIVRCHVTMN